MKKSVIQNSVSTGTKSHKSRFLTYNIRLAKGTIIIDIKMIAQILKQRLGYIFLLIIFTSCSNKPPEIIKIEGTERVHYIEKFDGWDEEYGAYRNERGGLSKKECFIVFNHPKNRSELINLINDFNRKTMTKDTLLKYDRGYLRVFYKKSYDTMEAYTRDRNDTSRYIDIDFYYMDKWCREAELIRVSWNVDSEQRIGITYYIYDDFSIISNVTDDELFNLK